MDAENINIPYPYTQAPQSGGMRMPYGGMTQIPQGMQQHDYEAEIENFCERHHNHYVVVETDDGRVYDGIIEGAEDGEMVLLTPAGDLNDEADGTRQYWFGGYYGVPFSVYGGFGVAIPFRFRRFYRYRFPYYRIRRFFFPYFY